MFLMHKDNVAAAAAAALMFIKYLMERFLLSIACVSLSWCVWLLKSIAWKGFFFPKRQFIELS
jgi:hypothetical protein